MLPVLSQTVLDLHTLAGAHATLSPAASMGRLMLFETVAAEAAAEQEKALRTRRISKKMADHLAKVADAAAAIGATELESVCERAIEVRATNDAAAIRGTAVLFSNTLERTRVAVATLFDFCEIIGIAPNGKALPDESTTPTPTPVPDSAPVTFTPL